VAGLYGDRRWWDGGGPQTDRASGDGRGCSELRDLLGPHSIEVLEFVLGGRLSDLVIPPQQEVPILNHVARRLGWGWERRRWWALDGRYGDVKRERRCEC
jgi:hypothetical protein